MARCSRGSRNHASPLPVEKRTNGRRAKPSFVTTVGRDALQVCISRWLVAGGEDE
jgi:hypothetical protein